MNSPRYRPDIDGLRALAVVPVVLYHAGAPFFGGGFVGVDVFFVISGFLITSLIYGEMSAGKFSLLRFYERRARRILPALFLVLFVTIGLSVAMLMPRDLDYYGDSLLGTSFFASNFVFWIDTGYFNIAAQSKPLLHTWSIAVEEQFYVVFPPLLFAMQRAGKHLVLPAIIAIALSSFALSWWGLAIWPAATFYLAPARAWELMLGAALAVWGPEGPQSAVVRNAAAAVGIALIGWSVFAFTSLTPFPGPAALLPCAGAAILIWLGSPEASAINRVLASRPFVYVGLISYSLYLWHWPLLVFLRYSAVDPVAPDATAAVVVASVVLAVLSWRYVENPFRKDGFLSRRGVLAAAASATMVLLLLDGAIIWTHGLPQRFDPPTQAILREATDSSALAVRCQVREPCRFGYPTAQPDFLLWGDSHAAAYFPAVEKVAMEQHRSGIFAGRGGCRPLAEVRRSTNPSCAIFTSEIMKIALRPDIREVVLAGRWASDQNVVPGQRLILSDNISEGLSATDNAGVLERALMRTVGLMVRAGKKVIIIAPTPEAGFSVPETMAKLHVRGVQRDLRIPEAVYDDHAGSVLNVLSTVHARFGASIIYPAKFFCSAGQCVVETAGLPLYRDAHHLSVRGAMLAVRALRSAL